MKKWAHDLHKEFSKEELQRTSKFMKKCSSSLVIKEMKIKTTLTFSLTQVRICHELTITNAGKNVEKQECGTIHNSQVMETANMPHH
jgi:hypothetical protein